MTIKKKKNLNAVSQREHHVTPTLEELSDAKVFSIVDAKCGYWNVVLGKVSSYLIWAIKIQARALWAQNVSRRLPNEDRPEIRSMITENDNVICNSYDTSAYKTTEKHDRDMNAMLKRCIDNGSS